ncbi:MAG: exodeoxyribonuclease VII large subunit [Clostridia bacterium]|nr:exodeoxyribonuclease VII large subunit [Clostridia bacterium]
MTAAVLTVSQVNSYVKQSLDGDRKLQNIFVNGEISNFKGNYSSGHWYFTLKDNRSAISAVMFSNNNARVRFKPQDGMKVIVSGRVSLYEVTGQYQFYVDSMQPDGKGGIALAYEQLRDKLQAQGLFDAKHKIPLPTLPKRIGVVSSASGSVIQDIKNVVGRRCPLSEIILYPSAVQGDGAAEQLSAGVRYFNSTGSADVIIIARGGGSMEDLFCFNDENLVWAIYDSHIPIISAVGHETDFTLCDFAADQRAPTPSAAAELAVPDREELLAAIKAIEKRMENRAAQCMYREYQDIDRLKDIITAKNPERQIEHQMLWLELYSTRINAAVENRLTAEFEQTNTLAAQINALSPIRLLQKGYSVTTKRGKCITSAKTLKEGDKVTVRFSDGSVQCKVIKEAN